MKKLLLLAMAVMLVFALVACGETQEEVEPAVQDLVSTQVEETPTEPVVEEETEPVGVGNTDESVLYLALEQYFKGNDPDIEDITLNSVKIYTPEEVEADEAIKSHDLKEGDFAFEIEYELKINDEVPSGDLLKYTAATGDIDGHRITDKFNLGIARNNGEDGYSIDAFGTGW